MSTKAKFVVGYIYTIIVILVTLGIGQCQGRIDARNIICAEYDGYRQIGNDTYCYRGSGDDIVFVLVEPCNGGD